MILCGCGRWALRTVAYLAFSPVSSRRWLIDARTASCSTPASAMVRFLASEYFIGFLVLIFPPHGPTQGDRRHAAPMAMVSSVSEGVRCTIATGGDDNCVALLGHARAGTFPSLPKWQTWIVRVPLPNWISHYLSPSAHLSSFPHQQYASTRRSTQWP